VSSPKSIDERKIGPRLEFRVYAVRPRTDALLQITTIAAFTVLAQPAGAWKTTKL